MPQFSALAATILLVFSLLRLCLVHFGGADTRQHVYAFLLSAYLVALALSGWGYVLFKRKIWGIAHAALMLGVAVFIGLAICFDKTDGKGGHGPDANPAGPILMLVRLIAGAIGIAALICGVSLGWRLLAPQCNDRQIKKPENVS